MIDIYCKDNKCPICGSTMKTSKIFDDNDDHRKSCKNGCYDYLWSSCVKMFYVFNVEFTQMLFDVKNYSLDIDEHNWDILKEKREKIENAINYWKENECYLIKILSNEK